MWGEEKEETRKTLKEIVKDEGTRDTGSERQTRGLKETTLHWKRKTNSLCRCRSLIHSHIYQLFTEHLQNVHRSKPG